MSKFLEEVLAKPPQAVTGPVVKPKEGLAGSPQRYAILLTLMAGLTAGPTWIMVRAGADELDVAAASPARPIVMGVPGAPPPANTPPPQAKERAEWIPQAPPPEQPVVPQQNPIIERTSIVDTSTRPVHKSKPRRAKPTPAKDTVTNVKPVQQPAPPQAEPVHQQTHNQPGTPKRKHKKRQHHVERPQRPQVEAPVRIERERS
jgi:hypothetical protein